MRHKKVEIYSSPTCPYCDRAKALLSSKGVTYIEYSIDNDEQRLQEMYTRANRRSIPQIFIGDAHIGGFDDLRKLNDLNQLDKKLEYSAAKIN